MPATTTRNFVPQGPIGVIVYAVMFLSEIAAEVRALRRANSESCAED